MGDESGALKCADQAKKTHGNADLDSPGKGALCLSLTILPDDEYLYRLLKASRASSSSVS